MKHTVLHIHFWADIRNSAGSVEKVITSFASQGQTWQHKIACLGRPGTAPYMYHDVLILPFWEDRLKNRALNKMLRLNAYSYSTLVSVIRRERPDVLHFHNRQELVDQVVRRLPYRPKIAVHFHRHFANPVVPAAADLLVFPSRTTAEYIRSATNTSKPFRVVFNPLSRELLAHAVQDGGLPDTRGGGAVILYGGGRNPIKGVHELIQAFTQMQCQSATLVLAGRGVETLGVRHPRIEVVGEMAADAFFERMQQSDIVAMPSYDEPFGLIAQEAMLLRRLLVVANSGGLAEFTDANCAVTVFPRSVAALVEGLDRAVAILGDPPLYRAMVDVGRQRVLHFTPEAVCRELEAAYSEIARSDQT